MQALRATIGKGATCNSSLAHCLEMFENFLNA